MPSVLMFTGNKLVRWSLTEILSQEGILTDAALTAKDALEKMAKRSYDLTIVDYEVRKTDDINILDKIEELFPSPNIIVLSAFVDEQQDAFLNRPNIFSVIKKPFSVGQIKDAAFSVLSSPQTKEGR